MECSIEIINFIIKNGQGLYSNLDRIKIKDFINLHIKYKTLIIVRDENGILVLVRWNVNEDAFFVLDLIIKRGSKEKNLIKRTLIKGCKMYPYVRYLGFAREKKYPGRGNRKYLIENILKRRS